MKELFLSVFNMGATASYLILAVMLFRVVFKKAPKIISCFMWYFVLFRLICPFSFESVFSLIPLEKAAEINNTVIHGDSLSGVVSLNVNHVIIKFGLGQIVISEEELFILSCVWLVGLTLMISYAVFSYFKIYNLTQNSAVYCENVYRCDEISTPFVFGIFNPKIYLPSSINQSDIEYVLKHERTHIKHFDHVFKLIMFLAVCMHWYNPLVWLAFILVSRDIELSCDETVVKSFDVMQKKAYSFALIDCSVSRKILSVCPLAFCETSVKDRVKAVLKYKKPRQWVIVSASFACVVIAFCMLTNPISYNENFDDPYEYEQTTRVVGTTYFDHTQVQTTPAPTQGYKDEVQTTFQGEYDTTTIVY